MQGGVAERHRNGHIRSGSDLHKQQARGGSDLGAILAAVESRKRPVAAAAMRAFPAVFQPGRLVPPRFATEDPDVDPLRTQIRQQNRAARPRVKPGQLQNPGPFQHFR